MIGIGYLESGQLEKAITAHERIRKYAPKNTIYLPYLAVAYVETGDKEKARSRVQPLIKNGLNLRKVLNMLPKKDPKLRERYASGLLEAGLPGVPGGYFEIIQENRLTQKEIKDLVFGHTATGLNGLDGNKWQILRAMDGEASYHCGDFSDTGKSWIENDMLCNQWKELYGGIKDCMPIFKNPEPRPEKEEEYIATPVYGVSPFSVAD
jgi:adenylate cyclase